ncbi:MAG: NADH-dependent [FeFe] hydrogenase, group A6 [Clostridia bacterium]
MKMVNITINGQAVSVPEGTTILAAARKIGVKIPTLCYLRDINAIGACRVCVVEVKGSRSLVASCVYPVREGLEIITNNKRVMDSRRTTVELILSDHEQNCLSCVRNGNCELQSLSEELGCNSRRFGGEVNNFKLDTSTSYLVRDNNKCVLCRRCVAACEKYQGIGVIGANSRGFDTHIGCAFEMNLAEVPCVGCGQCINVCPVGALHEREEIDDVFDALADKSKFTIIATAPSVRVGIGEEFGYPIGTNVEGKMVTALKQIGFNNVFDVNMTADLTIMEEGTEFLNRVQKGGALPLLTSCSPAWIKYVEHNYPEFIPNLSSCKSPQQMFGAICKTYYAEKMGIDPKDMVVISVMPCTAKKFEKGRADQSAAGVPDIDITLTTRELAKLIKRQGIEMSKLEDSKFDEPLGIYTGAGLLFGATGGVMEAALRTVYEILEKKELKDVNLVALRGTQGIKEATIHVGGMDVNVAVASGLANAKKILDMVKSGEKKYHFVEIMSCPGGCVNGGGQPIQSGDVRNNVDIQALRAKAIYDTDASMTLRKSHENPVVQEIYKTFLGEPSSHKAHEILHTTYAQRSNY